MAEDEMVGLEGHEFESALGVADGQEALCCGLVCCSPWSCKESDTTEWAPCGQRPLLVLYPLLSICLCLLSSPCCLPEGLGAKCQRGRG